MVRSVCMLKYTSGVHKQPGYFNGKLALPKPHTQFWPNGNSLVHACVQDREMGHGCIKKKAVGARGTVKKEEAKEGPQYMRITHRAAKAGSPEKEREILKHPRRDWHLTVLT